MPKAKTGNSALKKAKKLFLKHNISEDSEESSSSAESEEYSHVPIRETLTLIPLVDKLSCVEESGMTDINVQLASIMQQLQSINENQNRQQQAIDYLQRLEAPAVEPPEAPAVHQNTTGITLEHLSKIPDPIKSLPVFDGNRKQLSAWLTTAENTLNIFKSYVHEALFNMYVTAVTNKIQGKAKDILCLAGNPQDFDSIKEILINTLGDRQELSTYKSQLWQNKMVDGMSIHKYYTRTKEIVQNIKIISKQKANYADHWQAINEFIDEDALAAFIAGLNGSYFGYVQASRPRDLEEAYAFLCKFKAKEKIAHNMDVQQRPPYNKHVFEKPLYKPNTFMNKNSQRQEPTKHIYEKPEFKKYSQPPPQPMDVDPSTRSRLTLNKQIIQWYNQDSINPKIKDPLYAYLALYMTSYLNYKNSD